MQTIWPFAAFALLAIHLLAVQVAGAAPIVCCLLPKGQNLPHSDQAGRRLAKHAAVGLIVGVAIGLLLGWLAMQIHQRDYFPVLSRFYNRVWWGGWELLFSLAILLAVWLPWDYWVATKTRKIVQGLLAIIAATNLLYHFPPLLTVMADNLLNEGLRDTAAIERITSAEFRGLIAQPLVIAKSLHFVFAAVAVSGAWLMLLSPSSRNSGDDPARRGALIALAAMVVQMLLGMWIVVQVPPAEQSALIGGDPVASLMLLMSVVFSLGAMNQLGSVAMDATQEMTRSQIRSAAIGVLVIATIMIGVASRMSGLAG